MKPRIGYVIVIATIVIIAAVVYAATPISPEKAAERFLQSYKAMDLAGMTRYSISSVDGAGVVVNPWKFNDANQERIIKAVHARFGYKILGAEVNGNNAKVRVEVRGVDLARALQGVMSSMKPGPAPADPNALKQATDKAMDQLVAAIGSAEPRTVNSDLYLYKYREQWKVVFDEALARSFVNAISGDPSSGTVLPPATK